MRPLLLFAIALVVLTGCGPSRKDIALSQVNELADTWDGSEQFVATGNDPWGQAFTAKVEKSDAYNHLTLRSNGPDKLPQTGDDIVANRNVKHTPLSKVASKAAENISEGATRGVIAGIRDGIAGKKAEEKKEPEKR